MFFSPRDATAKQLITVAREIPHLVWQKTLQLTTDPNLELMRWRTYQVGISSDYNPHSVKTAKTLLMTNTRVKEFLTGTE